MSFLRTRCLSWCSGLLFAFLAWAQPGFAAVGDVSRTLSPPAGATSPQGLAWDGSALWLSDITTRFVFRIDPNSGAVLKQFQVYNALAGIPTRVDVLYDLTWVNGRLWVTDG